jgi:hypothetical protein
MREAISGYATVGQLQEAIAKHLHIADSQRIAIIARDGMRRGVLHGTHWEVIKVKRKWLCRWLSIDIAGEHSWVTFRALGRDYLYYLSRHNPVRALASVVDYFWDRVLGGVHQRPGLSRVHARTSSEGLTVRLNGAVKLWGFGFGFRCPPIQWGATYDVHLPDDVANTFSLEEAWLQKRTELCSVCSERKAPGDMPIANTTTSSPCCRHPPKTCRDCMTRWMDTRIKNGMLDHQSEGIACPDCSRPLGWHEVKRWASREAFARYDRQLLHGTLRTLPDFHYCLAPGCGSGQIHDAECPEFRCGACGARQCVRHNLPWHEGETCAEYDKRNPQRAREEWWSRDKIEGSSRACPKCGTAIYKAGGCAHVKCKERLPFPCS